MTRYRSAGPGRLEASFEDGRPFHGLDLRTGACSVLHCCGPDRYRGEFTVTSPDRFEVRWEVQGPSTSLLLESRYRRLHLEGGRTRT